jgi:outer membrane protein assembly factor BamB
MQWSKTFGGTGHDVGYSVQQTRDGGYIIVGYTASYGAGGYDVYLIKVDANGNMQWSRTFGGSGDDEGYSVQQTSDGGYIIVGSTTSYGAGGSDVYLIKVDANGNMQWSRTFGGARDDGGSSVQQTSDGGYIIVGGTASYGAGGYDVYLIKLGLGTIPTTTTTTVTVTTTVTQPITTTYTTTTTRVTTTTDTKTIPATITTTLHKTETQTLTTTATMPTIITVKEIITVTTIERPLFSEVTEALGISIAMVMVATLIGLWLRRR